MQPGFCIHYIVCGFLGQLLFQMHQSPQCSCAQTASPTGRVCTVVTESGTQHFWGLGMGPCHPRETPCVLPRPQLTLRWDLDLQSCEGLNREGMRSTPSGPEPLGLSSPLPPTEEPASLKMDRLPPAHRATKRPNASLGWASPGRAEHGVGARAWCCQAWCGL